MSPCILVLYTQHTLSLHTGKNWNQSWPRLWKVIASLPFCQCLHWKENKCEKLELNCPLRMGGGTLFLGLHYTHSGDSVSVRGLGLRLQCSVGWCGNGTPTQPIVSGYYQGQLYSYSHQLLLWHFLLRGSLDKQRV